MSDKLPQNFCEESIDETLIAEKAKSFCTRGMMRDILGTTRPRVDVFVRLSQVKIAHWIRNRTEKLIGIIKKEAQIKSAVFEDILLETLDLFAVNTKDGKELVNKVIIEHVCEKVKNEMRDNYHTEGNFGDDFTNDVYDLEINEKIGDVASSILDKYTNGNVSEGVFKLGTITGKNGTEDRHIIVNTGKSRIGDTLNEHKLGYDPSDVNIIDLEKRALINGEWV